jgi:uncharacterized membrane protein
MDILRDVFLISHFFGLALIIGPFVGRLRADGGYMFGVVFSGAIIQLVSGLVLTWLAEMRFADNDELAVDHVKIAVKLLLGLAIFVIALIAYRKQRSMGDSAPQRKLLPLLHASGALAIAAIIVAVVWEGVNRA